MRKGTVVVGIMILVSGLAACASVKDEKGNVVGTCIGAGCVLRAAFDQNVVDSNTGHLKGTIPLFSIEGASAPASTPVATTQQSASESSQSPTN